MLATNSLRIVPGFALVALLSATPAVAAEPPAPPPEADAAPAVSAPDEDDQSLLPRTIEVAPGEPLGAFPLAPPEGPARLLSGSLSIGPGWLALRDKQGRDGQGAMSLTARLGAVVAPEWCVFLGVDRSSTERDGATFAQTAGLFGAQRYFLGRLYLGGALAVAMVRESGVPDGLTDGPGWGFSALAGVEAVRGRHVALTAELSMTMAYYSQEAWEMGGLRIGVTFF
jgi:hypothetical protein